MKWPWKRKATGPTTEPPVQPNPEPEISEAVCQTLREVRELVERGRALRVETRALARDADAIREQNHFGLSLQAAMRGVH